MPQSSHRLPRANLRDLRFARALTVPASCLLPMARLQARKGGAADKYPTTHPTPEGRRGGEKRHFSAVGCVSVNWMRVLDLAHAKVQARCTRTF